MPSPWYRTDRHQWYVTIDGTQHPLGITDPSDLPGADAAHRRLIDDLAAGIAARLGRPANPTPGPSGVRPRSVSEAVAAYLAAVDDRVAAGRLKPKSAAGYRLALAHLTAAFGPRQLHTLSAAELERWADRPEWSASTQNDYLGTVATMLKHARVVMDPPIARPPKESRGADTCLTDDQFAAVLAEVKKYPNARGDLCELLTGLRETGARPSELARLRAEWVDWGNACTRVKDHKTRRHTGKDRVIHFNSAAMGILDRQRAKYGGGLLFRTRAGNAYRPETIVRRLRDVSDRVGFRVIAYGLGRHSFATNLLAKGASEPLVAELLGHNGTGMLARHYSHLGTRAAELKAVAELASKAAG